MRKLDEDVSACSAVKLINDGTISRYCFTALHTDCAVSAVWVLSSDGGLNLLGDTSWLTSLITCFLFHKFSIDSSQSQYQNGVMK